MEAPKEGDIADFLSHAAYYVDPKNLDRADFLVRPDLEAASIPSLRQRYGGAQVQGLPPLAAVQQKLHRAGFRPIICDRTTIDVAELGYAVVRAVVFGQQPLYAGQQWIPDDMRRIRQLCDYWNVPVPDTINRDIHPFP
jgi:hypothetical protein